MARAIILAILLATAALPVAAADAVAGTITILEGQALIYRGLGRVQAQEGVRLQLDDIVATAPKTLLQIELADRSVLQLGGDTNLMLGSSTSKQKSSERWLYLMDGWLKLIGAAKGAAGAAEPPFDLRAPLFEIEAGPAVLVVRATPAEATMFVERGSVRVVERPAGDTPVSVALEAGDSYQRAAGARGVANPGGTQAFIAAMPRSYRDTLPLRLERYKDAAVQPKPAPAFGYADVEAWLKAEPSLRRPLMQRWRKKAREPAFRTALIANLAAHPEWDPVLYPEKYRPKPPPPPPAPPPRPAASAPYVPAALPATGDVAPSSAR